MEQKFRDFLNKWNGQLNAGNTPENKGQCTGIVSLWIDVLNLPHVWGHAKDLMANADKKSFDVISNTPSGVPLKGDIICWNGNMGFGYGHTAIIVKADVNTFEVFEQNNPIGSNCHLRTYPNYNHVIGWFRPKAPSVPLEDIAKLKSKIHDLEQTQIRLNGEHEKAIADVRRECDTKLAAEKSVANLRINNYKSKILQLIQSATI